MEGKHIFKISSIVFIILANIIYNLNYIRANDQINFDSLTTEDGLSQSVVTSILQDSKNNMWIGTKDGLNRYNGYEFKVYKYDEKNKNSISSNAIRQIKEDKQSNLWILNNLGISKMNLKTEIITNYEQFFVEYGLDYIEANDILIAKNGHILLGTSEGLYVYDEKNDCFERILNDNSSTYDNNQCIYSLVQDNEGDIWVSTANGLDKISEKYMKVDSVISKDKGVEFYDVYKLYYDKGGYIWGATYNNGLIKINIKNNDIVNYQAGNEENLLPSNNITDILRDYSGDLWISTDNGLAKYNEKSNDFTIYKSREYYKNSLISDQILTISSSYGGSIWVGTYYGISVFHPKDKFYNYSNDISDGNSISSNKIKSVYEDEDGYIWLCTDKNIIDVIDSKTKNTYHIKEFGDLKFDDNSINYIIGRENLIYIGTVNGLLEINKVERTIKIYDKQSGLLCNNINILFLDSKGYLWIGSKDGINILNTKNSTLLDVDNYNGVNALEDKYVGAIFEDSEGNYYIGYSRHGGLIKINPNKNIIKRYKYDKNNKDSISSSSINGISEDVYGDIWIATRDGLNKFDKSSEKFTKYASKQGLLNNNTYGVIIDKENRPWVRSNIGISILNKEKEVFNNMNFFDTLQSNEFSKYAQYMTEDGTFLLGGENGLNVFNPKDINYLNIKKDIVLDYFRINGKEYKDIKDMKFDYHENNIDINFYYPSYKNNGTSVYRYSLEGGKSKGDWYSTKDTVVSYSNLEPGNYTFKIKSDSYNRIETEETSINFIIKPPIWKSSIAKFVYFILIVLAIYMSIKKVKRLNELVDKRKLQLENEREVSETLLKNIIALEQNKNKCFVNLSYELRTPITMINGTVQLVNQINRLENGISSKHLNYHIDVINKNCKRLLGVINNIIDSTKLENDSYIITLEEKDIVYVVEEAALGLKDYVESKGLELIIDTDIEEKIINCDEVEIERCIVNLVDNARKFTPRGGYIKVNIRDLNDKVEISVSDNGIGIDTRQQENIFDRFSQVLDMKKDALKGGSGLGLTITKQIIKKHKGIIYLESEEGKGSKFIIILPTNMLT